jgi:DNA invertase Pin-like site-specific DNA recombinase
MTKALDAVISATPNLIAYIRVSTARQGESGLGLDAQVDAINRYASAAGGSVVQTYREVESGRRADRPKLLKAIAHAKRLRGRLVIAKLDRLARNVHFVTEVMQSGVDFVACDNPHANKLTIHILAAVAEDEADRISQRTEAALAAAKARGVLLGSARPGHWQGREDQWRAAPEKASRAAKAKRDAESAPIYGAVRPIIRELIGQGQSLRGIAIHLNRRGFVTVHGAAWNPVQVHRVHRADCGTPHTELGGCDPRTRRSR